MVKKSFTILMLFLSAVFLSNTAMAQTVWTGEYSFDEDGGETAGGSKIFVAHTLTVSETDGKLTARLYSQGFQTSIDISATAVSGENKLDIVFENYGPDNAFTGLEKGDLMFSLELKVGSLLTNWAKFKPVLEANAGNGAVRFGKTLPGQANEDTWERVTYKDGDVSIAVPVDFIFDDRKTLGFNLSRLYGYYDGINIQLTRLKESDFLVKRYREQFEKGTANVQSIPEYYVINNPASVNENSFSKFILIVGPKLNLQILITGRLENISQIAKFINGISVMGTGLGEGNGSETAVTRDVSDIKRSEAVDIALKRKPGKSERDITYEIRSNNSDIPEAAADTRSAIVVEVPQPSKSSPVVPRILVQLRANGEVGDMVVYSSLPPKDLKKFVEEAAKTKFIPAVRDGKNVDSWTIITFFATFYINFR